MRVLIVDDSITMHQIESNNLAEMGIKDILVAHNGEEGLKQLAANMPVDYVLLDINMPLMDGMTVLKKIREDKAYDAVKVIMVTSESEKKTVLQALRLGANDYIVKPFGPQAFKERLQ